MNRYLCKCGRAVNKSTNADNTGNRETEGCEGCPYLMPWGPTEWDHTRHAMVTDVKGYECRMSPTLEYRTELHGHLDDKTTIRITSLDFDFLERVSDWVKEHYPNGELSGGFSRDRIRPAEYVDEGRYRYTLACSQNKKGIAAKRALWAEFFDETFHRKDMDADAEKAKILRDIERGKAAAHKDAAEMDKETNAMLIYRDPATGWLYRVSPQPEHGSYVMQYRDPANSATWKWCANWNIGNIYRESLEEVLEARAKRDGWELVSGPASSEPPEVVDEGEEYSPCDTCRCPDCIDSSCPQAGCDKTDGGFGCFAPYEECPAPAEETCPDERLEKEGRHWPLLWEVAYLARAFKDMIVQEADGKPRLTFRNRQGAAVLEDVAVEVSSSVQQQGDAWGALAANLLLELDDDGVPILKLDGGTY